MEELEPRLKRLGDALQKLDPAIGPRAALDRIVEIAREVADAREAAGCLTTRDRVLGRVIDEGIAAVVRETNRPLRLSRSERAAHPRRTAAAQAQTAVPKGLVTVPISDRAGLTIGVLQVAEKRLGEFAGKDEALLLLLARVASVLLETAARYDAVHKRETSLEAVITASPLPVVEMDREHRVLVWNPAAERVFGWRGDEVVGRPCPAIPSHRGAGRGRRVRGCAAPR